MFKVCSLYYLPTNVWFCAAGFGASAVGALRTRSPVNIIVSGLVGGTVITAVEIFTGGK